MHCEAKRKGICDELLMRCVIPASQSPCRRHCTRSAIPSSAGETSRGRAIPATISTASAASGIRAGTPAGTVDDEPHDAAGSMRQADDAEAAHLEQPGDRLTGRATSTPVQGRDLDPVVGDQPARSGRDAAPASSARARLDLPAPEAPRIRTPASPTTTQVAWIRHPPASAERRQADD